MLKYILKEKLNTIERGPIYRSLFDNGITYLFHHAKDHKMASVSLSFLAGSYFESKKEPGLAHLVEHLAFKESTSKLIKEMESLGAELNAYTTKELVSFEMSCYCDDLEFLLPLFIKKFCSLEFTKEQLKKEIKVIEYELKEDLDNHEVTGVEEFFSKSFSFSYGHSIGGNYKELRDFKSEDVRSYYNKFFTSERMILTIVSGKNKRYQSLIKKLFNAHTLSINKSVFRFTDSKKIKNKLFSSTVLKKMESSISFFGFEGPKINDKNYYEYIILDDYLFDGMSSVMFKKLREKRPLVYGMESSIDAFHNCGLYLMIFNGAAINVKEIKKELTQTLNHLSKTKISNDFIEKSKQRIFKAWEMSFDSLHERAEFMLNQEIYGLSHKSLADMRSELSKVSATSIQKLVKKLYKENNYSYLVYKNKEKKNGNN